MVVTVHMITQAEPIVIVGVRNAYQKGSLYCVMIDKKKVRKFPIEHIFEIVEDSSVSAPVAA